MSNTSQSLIKKIVVTFQDDQEVIIENEFTILSQIAGITNIPNFDYKVNGPGSQKVKTENGIFFIISGKNQNIVNELNSDIVEEIKSRVQF